MSPRSSHAPRHPTRKLTILAQDPSVLVKGHPLLVDVDVPMEDLEPGPRGCRVHVVDYDTSTGRFYPPARLPGNLPGGLKMQDILGDPAFHAQNAYAIVMRTLARFEYALGRRVAWSFGGHQIHVAPHAFADPNAFYSKEDRGLFFGYFTGSNGRRVYTCLAHDIVAHETTHALLDGLRQRYIHPSSPDQAAFHEGFGDVVALLSIFSLPAVVKRLLDRSEGRTGASASAGLTSTIDLRRLTADSLRQTALFGIGEEFGLRFPGKGESATAATALRRSAALDPKSADLTAAEFVEEHRRGEVFVAAMMNSFLAIWLRRIARLRAGGRRHVDLDLVAEAGSLAADHLLTMAIRALDYAPPTDLVFSDYLSALLTADLELQPNDSAYHYRRRLLRTFREYRIKPASKGSRAEPGIWEPPRTDLDYSLTHFDSLQKDPDEVFRFIWQNRKALRLCESAYTWVESVRPCTRVSWDGFTLRETVALYIQELNVRASELRSLELDRPRGMPDNLELELYGGGALVFDEFGRLKYHIHNSILNRKRQGERLRFLWDSGYFDETRPAARPFAEAHRQRLLGIEPRGGRKEKGNAGTF